MKRYKDMNYIQIREMDISNGPGIGISLFVSGCNIHCKNCFNKVAWDFNAGKPWTIEAEEKFIKLAKRPYIKRISILGGEPLDSKNAPVIADLLFKLRKEFGNTKKIWLYTGYTYETLVFANKNLRHVCETPEGKAIVLADYLVDGTYIHDLKDLNLLYRGSANQRIIDVKKTLYEGAPYLRKD